MEQNSPTFSETWGAVLITKFSDFCYVNPFRWYLRSYSKVTKYAPNFWTYFVFPHVIDLPPTRCTKIITTTQRHVELKTFREIAPTIKTL